MTKLSRETFEDESSGAEALSLQTLSADCTLTTFEPLKRLFAQSKPTFATADPVPTELMQFVDVLLPVSVIQQTIKLSLLSGTVPDAFKKAVVKPLLKKNQPQTLTPLVTTV